MNNHDDPDKWGRWPFSDVKRHPSFRRREQRRVLWEWIGWMTAMVLAVGLLVVMWWIVYIWR